MSDARILYVSKGSNHHESITHLGGDSWKWTRAQVIESIENKTNTFYTMAGGKRANVEVRQGKSGKYVQTHADGEWNNNLLALPDFPRTASASR
jgi:Protein of unknown function (DUF3892)